MTSVFFDDIYTTLNEFLGIVEQLKLKCCNKYHNKKIISIEMLEHNKFKLRYPRTKISFKLSCMNGFVNLAKSIRKYYMPKILLDNKDDDFILWTACKNNHMLVVQYLCESGDFDINLEDIDRCIKAATVQNNIDIVKWLCDFYHRTNMYLLT